MISSRIATLYLVLFVVQGLSALNAWSATNQSKTPSQPCQSGCDDCCKIQWSAVGASIGNDGVGGLGLPGSGGGCASGNCGSGGVNPQFAAIVGINGDGAAGFSVSLGGSVTPGGMDNGILYFQVKTLSGVGIPISALQYSQATAKPVVLANGRVLITDVRNVRQDYAPSTNNILTAINPRNRTTLRLLGAQGQPVTNAPASIDLVNASGDILRYRVGNTNLPEVAALPEYLVYNNKLGFWRNPSDQGFATTRDANGFLSEIVTPSCVTRILPVNTYTFDVAVFPPEIKTSAVPPIVTYRVAGDTPGVESFSADRSMSIREMRPGYTNLSTFSYNPLNERWTLIEGNGERILNRMVVGSLSDGMVIMDLHDASGRQLSHREDVRKSFAWGVEVVSTTMGTGTCATVTSNDFYTLSGEVGRYAQIKDIIQSTGEWTKFDYDAQGRTIREIRSWKNIPFSTGASTTNADVITYDYGSDPLNPWPVVTTESIEGKVVRKSFYSNQKRVMESFAPPAPDAYDVEVKTVRAASAGATQGNNSNLVSTDIFYGSGCNAASQGALKTQTREDGTMERYEYAFGTYLGTNDPCFTEGTGNYHRTIRKRGTTQSIGGIAYKTTRDITIRDPKGHVVFEETRVYTGFNDQRMSWVSHSYNLAGNRIRSDFADGTFRTWDYTTGRLASSTDRDGTVMTYNYDGFGRPMDTVHQGVPSFGDYPYQLDRTTTRLYDAMHRPVADIQSSGDLSLSSHRDYDMLGRPVAETDARGLVTQYGYAGNGLTRTVTSPGGSVVTTVNNIDGRPCSTAEDGVLKSYNDYGVNSDGTRWDKVYSGPAGTSSPMWSKTTTDFLGRTVLQEKPGFGGVTITNAYVYNTRGQLIRTTGTQQPPMLYAYDSLGQQIQSGLDVNTNGTLDLAGPDRVSEVSRQYTQLDADWYDETLSLVYPNASAVPVTNAINRSSAGGLSCGCATLKSESEDVLGHVTVSATVVDPVHRLVTKSVLSPFGTNSATSITYNGLPVESTSATGVKTIFTYDALGRQVSALQGGAASPRMVGSYTVYNDLGQVAYTMDAASNKTFFSYDSAGRRSAVADALTNTTHTAYDAEGRVLATWGATYPVAYDYDDYGRMTAMYTYRGGNSVSSYSELFNQKSQMDQTRWLYDETTGVLTNKLYADNRGPCYTYTVDGKLATRTWARGITTSYAYDGIGQLTNITYSDNTPAVSFAYDRLGRQTTITDAQGTRNFTYNDALQLAAETNSQGVLQYAFDGLGRPAGLDAGAGYSVRYNYDLLGRFSSVSNNVGGVGSAATYSYVTGSDLVSGYSTDAGFSLARTYEANRNLISSIANRFGNVPMHRFDYVNDEVGRRTQRADVDISTVISNLFAYNVRSELTDAQMSTNSFSYRYDPIGNRTVATNNAEVWSYAANSLNQYSQLTNNQAPITPSYDLDGNMTGYKGWTFVWDAENRLVLASNGTTVVSNAYDYMSRRVSETTQQLNNPTTETHFLYQGWAMISEHTATTTNSYVYGLDLSGTSQGAGTIGGILSASFNGTAAFFAYDANGNVTDLVGTNGSFLAQYQFDPYGKTISKSGDLADVNPFRFSTKYTDSETGLLYYGYRYYLPESGRWLSRDPIQERGGRNLYGFVGNRPVGRVDILGLWQWPWEGCCDGKTYNRFTKCCCCNGQTTRNGGSGCATLEKTDVDTGVAQDGFTASNDTDKWQSHTWLTYPGGSAGYNAYNSGVLSSPDPYALGGLPTVPGSSSHDPVKLSPCDYDIKKFVACIASFASTWTPTGDCSTFVAATLSQCMSQSKGCGGK